MPSSFETMMQAIDDYQARTGMSDRELSKRTVGELSYIGKVRRNGRLQGALDRFDAIIAFCESGAP